MPSFKMKAQLSTRCLREKKGLRVCQKSIMISKKTCSQYAADSDTCNNCEEVCSSTQMSTTEMESDETIDHQVLLGEQHCQIQKQSCDCLTEWMDSFHTCPSNLERISSPALDAIEGHAEPNSEPIANIDTGFGAGDSDDNQSSCDNRTCNVPDFYIADMFISSSPFNENTFFDVIGGANCFLDYKCAEPNMLFDVSEPCMVFPFLEDTIRSSNIDTNDGKSADCAGVFLEFGQMSPCNQKTVNSSDSDQAESFDPQLFIRNLPELLDVESNFQPTLLPEGAARRKSVTLVLDLDETLVHSTLDYCEDADFTFTIFFNMKEQTVYVKRRPHLQTFLERVSEMFEVVIFTASQSIYASQLLDILDPYAKLISRRAYWESCIFSDGSYTKDLTVLDVDLAKVAIIDNTPQVFRLQVNNGIPIKSWFDDPSDSALILLIPFLETLVDADDVRPIIAKRFGNKE